MTTTFIILIIIIGCAIINPILYFIYWEIYNRKKWIDFRKNNKWDERFWSTEGEYMKRKQIAPVRPQIKDVLIDVDELWLWFWFLPIISSFTTLVYFGQIIFYPLKKLVGIFIRKIENIKI